MNPHFLRGFAEAVLLAAALFAAWSIKANATEFFPTLAEAKAAAHGKRIAWICEGKATLYYVGKAGEKTCAHDRPRTTEGERPDDRRARSVRSDHVVADRSSRASSRGVAGVPPEPTTDGLAPRTLPAPSYYPTFADRWEGEPRETPAAYQSLEQALRWAIPGRRVVARMMEARR